jgi:bacillopeptidase F
MKQDISWGATKIGAPKAWARGFDGTGVTIGIVDTGLDASHPALRAKYRGTQADGSQVNDYNWFDAISGKSAPYDDGEHGTHVAGIAVGSDPERATGVAPGAKIIAAKGLRGDGLNTMDGTLRALQWMLAPTKTDGSAPDPTKGADIVNNSWGIEDQDETSFLDSLRALEAAGIEVVNAAGNDGPYEGTVSPPGSYPGLFSVAASTSRDDVARFSSRGPSLFSKPGDMVPTFAAPGQGIYSTIPGGYYTTMDGTSMASPNVAGAVALLLQAKPQATHAELEAALASTAVDIDAKGPDAASGYGRIDVDAALTKLTGGAA